MNPRYTDEFAAVKRHLNEIARSEPVQGLKDDIVYDFIKFAAKVPKIYDNRISIKKGHEDSKKGAVTAVVAALVFSVVKSNLEQVIDLDPGLESAISVVITGLVSGAFHGLQSWFWNWRKHRVYKVQ